MQKAATTTESAESITAIVLPIPNRPAMEAVPTATVPLPVLQGPLLSVGVIRGTGPTLTGITTGSDASNSFLCLPINMNQTRDTMQKFLLNAALAAMLAGCAQTDIQPLTRTSFKVATSAAPACGPSGARRVANQAAAIEVINRGGDRFVFVGDQSGSRMTGMTYNAYTGFETYNTHDQAMVVQMVQKGDGNYNDALSAREILGPEWQQKVSDGIPDTCSSSS